MFIATFLVFVPVSWALQSWGNHGLWLAFSLYLLSRGICQGWVYARLTRQRRWLLS